MEKAEQENRPEPEGRAYYRYVTGSGRFSLMLNNGQVKFLRCFFDDKSVLRLLDVVVFVAWK